MTSNNELLRDALQAIIDRGPATSGVAVRHIERGEALSFDGDTPYPTASVFKIPVMVEAFRRIGQGEFSLDDRWELAETDKSTGSGVLVRLAPGLRPTVRDLVTLMIIISDNTATDILVRRLGAERISSTMRDLGLRNTVVAETCRGLLRGILGDAPPSFAPHEMGQHLEAHPADPESPAYAGTPDNNISTANEMVDLLSRLHTGEGMEAIGINASRRRTIREILLLQQLNERMPAFLPRRVPVAHKTGSLPGPWAIRNDAGLMDLGDKGTVAMAAFTRTRVAEGTSPQETTLLLHRIDEEIAALTRAVYDHYATSN